MNSTSANVCLIAACVLVLLAACSDNAKLLYIGLVFIIAAPIFEFI